MRTTGRRIGGLSGVVVAVALVASCSTVSPTATVSPSSQPAAQVTPQSWAGRGTLAVYDGVVASRTDRHTISVVGFSGASNETAKVLSTTTLAKRTAINFKVICSVPCGATDPPYVSTSRSHIYVLDGDTSVLSLAPDGSTMKITSIPGDATERAAFAVSPDDSLIAVGVIDLQPQGTKVYVEKLGGGGRVDVFTEAGPNLYWPIGWRNGQVVLASGTNTETLWNPYNARGYALVDPVAGAQPTPMSSKDCVPTGLLSPAGTACVSNPGAHCLGALVSQSGPYSYYSSCLRRLDWSGKETVFLLPDYYQTSSMVANPAALSPNGKALITDWLFVALEPDARGFGGNQFVLGYGNPSSEQDVGWIDSNHVTWSFKYPDGSAAQRIIRLGDDYASASNVDYDGYPEVAGAPQSPVTGHLAATVPESL